MNIRTFVAILSRNPQHDFPKMRGGGQRPFGTLELCMFHDFWGVYKMAALGPQSSILGPRTRSSILGPQSSIHNSQFLILKYSGSHKLFKCDTHKIWKHFFLCSRNAKNSLFKKLNLRHFCQRISQNISTVEDFFDQISLCELSASCASL